MFEAIRTIGLYLLFGIGGFVTAVIHPALSLFIYLLLEAADDVIAKYIYLITAIIGAILHEMALDEYYGELINKCYQNKQR